MIASCGRPATDHRVLRCCTELLLTAVHGPLSDATWATRHSASNVDDVRDYRVACSSASMSRAADRDSRRRCDKRLGTAHPRAEREIDLLREYRTRLIADVVTGKLDVREAAARLPDEVEEPEPLDETEADDDLDADATDDSTPTRGGRGMTTDTSESGLERLICTALTGAPCDPGRRPPSAVHERPPAYGAGWICGSARGLRPRVLRRPGPALGLPAGHAAGGRRGARPRPGRPDAAQVPRPAAGRDRQARRHRRAAQGRQARAASLRPVLRHAVAGQRQGRGAATPQNRFSVTRQLALQPRRDAAARSTCACSSTACRSPRSS